MSEKIAVVGKRPHSTSGMRHVALFVPDFDAACHFYIELMGMAVEWQPDPDNIYLCSGSDNVALHNKPDNVNLDPAHQRLDHIGFIIVDENGKKYIAESSSSYGGTTITEFDKRIADLTKRKPEFNYEIVSDTKQK